MRCPWSHLMRLKPAAKAAFYVLFLNNNTRTRLRFAHGTLSINIKTAILSFRAKTGRGGLTGRGYSSHFSRLYKPGAEESCCNNVEIHLRRQNHELSRSCFVKIPLEDGSNSWYHSQFSHFLKYWVTWLLWAFPLACGCRMLAAWTNHKWEQPQSGEMFII